MDDHTSTKTTYSETTRLEEHGWEHAPDPGYTLDLNQDILRSLLRVLEEDVEVAIVVKDTSIQ
jgi:hypothetical protein